MATTWINYIVNDLLKNFFGINDNDYEVTKETQFIVGSCLGFAGVVGWIIYQHTKEAKEELNLSIAKNTLLVDEKVLDVTGRIDYVKSEVKNLTTEISKMQTHHEIGLLELDSQKNLSDEFRAKIDEIYKLTTDWSHKIDKIAEIQERQQLEITQLSMISHGHEEYLNENSKALELARMDKSDGDNLDDYFSPSTPDINNAMLEIKSHVLNFAEDYIRSYTTDMSRNFKKEIDDIKDDIFHLSETDIERERKIYQTIEDYDVLRTESECKLKNQMADLETKLTDTLMKKMNDLNLNQPQQSQTYNYKHTESVSSDSLLSKNATPVESRVTSPIAMSTPVVEV